MRQLPSFALLGAALIGAQIPVACTPCPASFREVPAPHAVNSATVGSLSRCQVEHYGATLLGQAPDAATAKALLSRGAKVHSKLIIQGKEYSGTPLNLARTPELVRVLAAAGANPNQSFGLDGSTPLCAALRQGNAALAAALLAAGANPNLMDAKGEPPLCIAAASGNTQLCDMLIYQGAHIDMGRKEDGVTPLLAAMKAAGMKSPSEAGLATIQTLLEAGANLFAADANGTLPLHIAPIPLIPVLLSRGADVNCRDLRGRTPLFYGGSTQRLDVLLQYGADINARDREGYSAFDVVTEAPLKSYLLLHGCGSEKSL